MDEAKLEKARRKIFGFLREVDLDPYEAVLLLGVCHHQLRDAIDSRNQEINKPKHGVGG
jgi:hypothetical protein